MTIDVKQLIKEASEAAKHAPDHLQEAAFNKAFEALMAAQQEGKSPETQFHSGRGQKAPKKRKSTGSSKVTSPAKKGSKKRKVGSWAALRQLYESGFFSSPKTIADITEQLKHKHGRIFKSNEISPALLRYLRDDKLTREKNSENQYEYQEN